MHIRVCVSYIVFPILHKRILNKKGAIAVMKKTYGLIVFLLFFSFLFSSCGTGGTQQFPNMWTWVSGSNTVDQYGIYTDPTPGNNVPGARALSVSWIDKSGNLWLFGGYSYDSRAT